MVKIMSRQILKQYEVRACAVSATWLSRIYRGLMAEFYDRLAVLVFS